MPDNSSHNYYYTTNLGISWRSSSVRSPFGYRSCIRIINNKALVACGTTGVDFTLNADKEWKKASQESFNVCMVSKGKAVFLAGEKGKIGKLIY